MTKTPNEGYIGSSLLKRSTTKKGKTSAVRPMCLFHCFDPNLLNLLLSKVEAVLSVPFHQVYEFSPRVGQHQVLDASFGVIENVLVETGDVETTSVSLW
jgi:hypothetical protein